MLALLKRLTRPESGSPALRRGAADQNAQIARLVERLTLADAEVAALRAQAFEAQMQLRAQQAAAGGH